MVVTASIFSLILMLCITSVWSAATTMSDPTTTTSTDQMTAVTRFKKVMRLVQAGRLQDCAGRVVCDLNCDPGRYGAAGDKVLTMMTKVTEAGVMDVEDMSLLGSAGVSGRMYYWTSGCGRCRDVYPNCFAESEDLIDVASIIDF